METASIVGSQVAAATLRALDAIGGVCPACKLNGEPAMLEFRGSFDGRMPSSGVQHGHRGFGATYMCERGHWFALVMGRLCPPEHILTVVD